LKIKKASLEQEKLIDKMVIDQIIEDEKKKNEQFKLKKEDFKNYFKELKKQNDFKADYKKNLTEQKRIEDKIFLENYKNMLEKEDFERSQDRVNRINHFQNIFEKTNNTNNITLIKKAVKLDQFLDKKYEKEKKELDEK
jgi:hypothetical protein